MRNCSGLSKLNLSTSLDVENLLSVDPWRKWKRWWSKSFVTWNAIRSSSVTDVIRSLQVAPRAMARALLCLCLESGSQEDTNILESRSFLASACARSCVYFQMWTVSLPRTQATPSWFRFTLLRDSTWNSPRRTVPWVLQVTERTACKEFNSNEYQHFDGFFKKTFLSRTFVLCIHDGSYSHQINL